MKNASQFIFGSFAALLMLFSLGCQPPKPPAPATDDGAPVAAASDNTTDNTTANTTAVAETPVGETPADETPEEESSGE